MPPGSIACMASSLAEDVQRGAALASGFGEHQRAVGKIERGEVVAAAELRARGPPVQAPGDHQVKHEPEVVVEADGDALADAAQLADVRPSTSATAAGRAQQKGAGDANMLERLADDALFERVDVGGDVGQLRHGYQLARTTASFARWSGLIRNEARSPDRQVPRVAQADTLR